MRLKKTIKLVAITAIVASATVVAGSNTTNNAVVHAEEAPKPTKTSTETSYSYVAQPGDSYTKMARKALQTYGKKAKVNISQAGIVFAETNLTKQAGSPALEISQKVEFKESVVKDWADKALKLTDTEKSAWNYYVQFVNFNTDKVGKVS